MKRIELTQGKIAIIDDGDFDLVNQYKWHFSKGYAATSKHNSCKSKCKGKGCLKIFMHRLIMGNPKGILIKIQVDHINRNTLDNRSENLRIVTHAQNMLNRSKHKNNTSGYNGISFDKKAGS